MTSFAFAFCVLDMSVRVDAVLVCHFIDNVVAADNVAAADNAVAADNVFVYFTYVIRTDSSSIMNWKVN